VENIEKTLFDISEAVKAFDKEKTAKLVRVLVEKEVEPKKIIRDGLIIGIDYVIGKFKTLEYFLPQLIYASEAVQSGIDVLLENLDSDSRKELIKGKVVIGTTRGDIHDVGKNIFSTLLTASGYEVIDLGIDKSIDDFIDRAEDVGADIIAISCLMTTSLAQLKELVQDLKRLNVRNKYKVIVGGGAVQREFAEEIGADGYALEASDGVELCRKILESKEV
jgi:methylmalonyl-CoA mutase cobalamin-binding domain/chain